MEAPARVQPWGRVKRRCEAQVPDMAVPETLWRVNPTWPKGRGGEQESGFGSGHICRVSVAHDDRGTG